MAVAKFLERVDSCGSYRCLGIPPNGLCNGAPMTGLRRPGPRLRVSWLLAEIGQVWCIEVLDRALVTATGDRVMTLTRGQVLRVGRYHTPP